MFKNWKALFGAFVLSAGMFGAGAAFTSQAHAQVISTPYPRYTPTPYSNHNLRFVYRRLERLIDQMQRDAHDYGGHRVRALQYLQQARAEIQAGLSWDQQHGGGSQTMHPF